MDTTYTQIAAKYSTIYAIVLKVVKKEKGPAPLPPSQTTNSTISAGQKELADDKLFNLKESDDKIVDLLRRNEVAVPSSRLAIDDADSAELPESKVNISY